MAPGLPRAYDLDAIQDMADETVFLSRAATADHLKREICLSIEKASGNGDW